MRVEKIVVVIGTRPTFVELAPVIHELQKTGREILIYHTGQHYDKDMSDVFMKQLEIPKPHQNLNAGGGTFAEQISTILTGCECLLKKDQPDILLVEGDTNTAFASALAAANAKIPVVHIEAGCRSFDKSLPEEVNRVLISHITDIHFPPTQNCRQNLLKEGIKEDAIKFVGHPIVDSVNLIKNKLRDSSKLGLDIEANKYYYVTIHRDFNTDDPSRLERILKELSKISEKKKIIFPIHPRTKSRIEQFGLVKYLQNITAILPVDYITSLSLTRNAYAVISDSGGLTKECCLFGIPYVSLRPNTEWIETLTGYSNQLAFKHGNTIAGCIENLVKNYEIAKQNMRSLQGLFGNVGVSGKIADQICNIEIDKLTK
ncbi:MAG: UDP-N-acetylglucosamine 2-epimerase (non-hydrolyzing) [Thaumarchaeota archaeon]|nr:UDP-N-acetylglucosamine 2-epimerase (non-hydrolyzing) [Nitrososphaerota archaeon]